MTKTITAYKAFSKDMTCRDFQYEVGKTYTHNGDVSVCDQGFHACENPFDCWSYYDLIDSRYARVELSGEVDSSSDDSKIAAAQITIKAEIKLPEFIQQSINWLLDCTKKKNDEPDSAQMASSGDSAKMASSGYSAQMASSGYYAKMASSGDYAQMASSGDSAKMASSGDSAKMASSGDYAQMASSGDYAKIEAAGENAVIASSGVNARAKGVKGVWLSLAEFDENGCCVGFATGQIGVNGLKENTFYRAKNGQLVEA